MGGQNSLVNFRWIVLLCHQNETIMQTELSKTIIDALPYGEMFLFVDKITEVNEESISGIYCFDRHDNYMEAHFAHRQIVPGVLLLECMGQIGLVAHGIHLLNLREDEWEPALSHVNVEFFSTVKPGTEVIVRAQKTYLRRNTLRSMIEMRDSVNDALIARADGLCKFVMNKDKKE